MWLINHGITANVNVTVKNIIYVKKNVSNPSTSIHENGKYLASIVDDSVIRSDEVIKSYEEEIKSIPTNFNEKKFNLWSTKFLYLLLFLLITIALLIAVSIYRYLIKYQAKQKHLLSFHDTKLKQFCVGSMNWKWEIKLKI